jgi:hypothetical protein
MRLVIVYMEDVVFKKSYRLMMDNNKKHNILQMGLATLMFSILGINICYAADPAEIVSVFRADHMYLDSSEYEQIDDNVFRFITYTSEKCGIPIFTLFDEKEGSLYEELDTDRESEPKDIDRIKWIVTNTIKNNGVAILPKSYTLIFDENSSDPRCAAKHENITNLEINPYIFSKEDEVKKLTIKNIYSHDIELTYISDDQAIQKYVTIPNASEPINIPAGETYTLELHPGVCPAGSAKEPRVLLKFSYKVKVNDNFYEKTLPISVGVFCHRELERAIEDRDAALSALEALKLEQTATVQAAVNDMQNACEAACISELKKCGAKNRKYS